MLAPMVEIGVVAKAQVSRHIALTDGLVGIADDTLPQRDGRTGRCTVVVGAHAVDRPHAQVVLVVDRAPLAVGQHIVERDVQLHILHVGGNGMQFGH